VKSWVAGLEMKWKLDDGDNGRIEFIRYTKDLSNKKVIKLASFDQGRKRRGREESWKLRIGME
jgi:hypothetical protein